MMLMARSTKATRGRVRVSSTDGYSIHLHPGMYSQLVLSVKVTLVLTLLSSSSMVKEVTLVVFRLVERLLLVVVVVASLLVALLDMAECLRFR